MSSGMESYLPTEQQIAKKAWLEVNSSKTCKPVQRIVYIKTHKTGSTTMVSILQRYGYLRNLSFAMRKGSHIISEKNLFMAEMVYRIPHRTMAYDFDMLVNHARYNRKEMDIAVPQATYITIIRNPVEQLESVFGYFEVGFHLSIRGSNRFKTFMSNPLKYYIMRKGHWQQLRNGQLFDLGFDHKNDENRKKIQLRINKLSREIDLVMINEYFDESLILLKRLLCWEYGDILYLSHGIRSKSHRFTVSADVAANVKEWSAGDVMLYDHFNRTFWQLVKDYGPGFQEDVAIFRELEQKMFEECVNMEEKNLGDRRVEKLKLMKDTPIYCRDLLRGDIEYTTLIRRGMVLRAGEETERDMRERRSKAYSASHGWNQSRWKVPSVRAKSTRFLPTKYRSEIVKTNHQLI